MKLSEDQVDYLKEIINIGIGRSANALNKIVKNRVTLKVPILQIITFQEFNSRLESSTGNLLSIVSMDFKGDLSGKVELVFPSPSAVKIVDILTDKAYNDLEMDQLRSSTLNEVGNIVLNSLIGTLGNLLKTRFRFSIPRFKECAINEVTRANCSSDYFIYAETHFSVNDINIDGRFTLFLEPQSHEHFIELLNKSMNF
ncbi:MAG: hypothetical protein HOO91_02620 [Bacteroidales bacterium]|nr:hypothetical protein [Bacteroidales bacterium]